MAPVLKRQIETSACFGNALPLPQVSLGEMLEVRVDRKMQSIYVLSHIFIDQMGKGQIGG